ncbi:MAG: zinc ribbon domain-containing protein [Bryobacterales bacterium]|nr:zinc ribbon domain-containing protein [Bryobacterales bacterium]MBV9400550.1 zinc ribbon domain-containing protein [Bryobacterales bacterium]
MPIYDFECSDCGERFEALVLRNNTASCPKCNSQKLEQQISMFAVDSEATRQAHISIARKKNAKIQRDKSIAEHEQAINHYD